MRYSQHLNLRVTPQSHPIPGSTQVPNSAGSYAWQVDKWSLLDRFLILGTEGGSYYATEKEATLTAGNGLLDCIAEDGPRTVARIVEISEAGRAPKNDPCVFALAACAGNQNPAAREAALAALPRVCRIGTDLFRFSREVEAFRGWGRRLRRAIGEWYTGKAPEDLGYQVVKYRQREGTTHRDLLRLASPTPTTPAHDALFRWIIGADFGERTVEPGKAGGKQRHYPAVDPGLLPEIIMAFDRAQSCTGPEAAVALLSQYPRLPWEALPNEVLGSPDVWRALLPNLPLRALTRNLARMTANGALVPMGAEVATVCQRLSDEDAIRKARLHPIQCLTALCTYAAGRGQRGTLTWTPIPQIVDALDGAFYAAFANVQPTGKRTLLAVDTSGSMMHGEVAGVLGLSPRKAASTMAMVTARTETVWQCIGFSDFVQPVALSPRQRLDDVMKVFDGPPHGTDCSLSMQWAMQNGVEVDVFVEYTDHQTWAGGIHPAQALRQYREKTGIPAKLVVCGMVANEYSIADPGDPAMLNVVGFDTSTPQAIAEFSRL